MGLGRACFWEEWGCYCPDLSHFSLSSFRFQWNIMFVNFSLHMSLMTGYIQLKRGLDIPLTDAAGLMTWAKRNCWNWLLECTWDIHESNSASHCGRKCIAHFPGCPSCLQWAGRSPWRGTEIQRAVWWHLLGSLKSQSSWNATFSVKGPRTPTISGWISSEDFIENYILNYWHIHLFPKLIPL